MRHNKKKHVILYDAATSVPLLALAVPAVLILLLVAGIGVLTYRAILRAREEHRSKDRQDKE